MVIPFSRSRRVVVIALGGLFFGGGIDAQEEVATTFPRQYKRVHQKAFKAVLEGGWEQAAADLEDLVSQMPGDGESHLMLAVARVAGGDLERAVASAQMALENGIDPGRILGGTLTGLEPLRETGFGKKLVAAHGGELVHGPALGCVTGESVRVWVRTARDAGVYVIASESETLDHGTKSDVARASRASDFTAVATITGLKPSTEYHYAVWIDGARVPGQARFKTFPRAGAPVAFRFVFGGGSGFVPPNEHVWDTIREQGPDVLLLLGDNIYSDDPGTPPMQHYCYYRRQSRPEFRRLVAGAPVYSIWDDHDFGTNDSSGGPEIDVPAWKRPVFEVFRNNWVNPGYGGGDAQPGCYYDFQLGDVHFIMLDGRYYRDLEGGATGGRPTMLGPVQLRWLLDTLGRSEAKFRFLCSPVPWVFGAKGKSKDTWNGFKEERAIIFDLLAEKKIGGVVLMSADRHRSDLWKIDRPAGHYPLYEFNSSRLTNQHVHSEMPEAVFSYNRKQSFGVVDVDTTAQDSTVRYSIVNSDGETVHRSELKRSELE